MMRAMTETRNKLLMALATSLLYQIHTPHIDQVRLFDERRRNSQWLAAVVPREDSSLSTSLLMTRLIIIHVKVCSLVPRPHPLLNETCRG